MNNSTFYFCTFSHFVNKRGMLWSRIHPIVWVAFYTSACTHGHVYMSVMRVCLLCVFCGLSLLLSVNFYKHEGKLQNLVENLCYQYTCRLLKCGEITNSFQVLLVSLLGCLLWLLTVHGFSSYRHEFKHLFCVGLLTYLSNFENTWMLFWF